MEQNEALSPDIKKSVKRQVMNISIITACIVMGIIIFTNAVFIGIVALMGDSFTTFTEKYLDEISSSLVIQDIVMIIGLIVGAVLLKVDIKSHFAKPQMKISEIISLGIMGVGLSQIAAVGTNIVMTLIEQLTGAEIGQVTFIAERNLPSTIFMFIAMAFIGPVLEELFFRGLFFTPLIPHGRTFAVVATAIIFGLYHMNIPQILPAMIMGFFFAYISVESRSIIPAMCIHIINNTLAAIDYVCLAGIDMNKISDITYINENAGKLVPLFIVVGIIYAFIFASIPLFIVRFVKRGKNAFRVSGSENDGKVLKNSELAKAYFLNPAVIILLIMVIGMTAFTVIGGRG